VRDAGRHFADRREPLLKPRIPLQLLDIRDVLKREEQARVASGRLQRRRRETQIDLPAIAGAIRRLDSATAQWIRQAPELTCHIRRQFQHLFQPPADN
jgi:hypothetical protein